MLRIRTSLLATWLLPLLLIGSWPRPAPAAPDDEPTFRVRPLRGKPFTGNLRTIEGLDITIGTEAGDRTLPLSEIVEIGRETRPASPLAGEAHLRVHLAGGERLIGTFAEAVPDGFVLAAPDSMRTAVLFDVVRTLVVVPGDAGPCYEPEARHPAGEEDVAYLASGDAYVGLLVSADAQGIRIETERKQVREIPWTDLRVLHLANDPVERPSGVQVEVETLAGSRLTAGGKLRLEDGRLVFPLLSDKEVTMRVPLASVRTIRPSGGAFVYASSLPFTSTFETPYGGGEGDEIEREFLDAWYAARVDRRPTGCPLRLGGRVIRHGFAVHARSTVTVELAGAYRTFQTVFGIDDEALAVPAGGIVDARVIADGKVLWEAVGVKAGETPRAVGPLDVTGRATLVLEVDFGEELHIRDRATWAEPILVRAEGN